MESISMLSGLRGTPGLGNSPPIFNTTGYSKRARATLNGCLGCGPYQPRASLRGLGAGGIADLPFVDPGTGQEFGVPGNEGGSSGPSTTSPLVKFLLLGAVAYGVYSYYR